MLDTVKLFYLSVSFVLLTSFLSIEILPQTQMDQPKLKDNASLEEVLNWLTETSIPRAGIGIDDKRNPVNGRTNVMIHKGFLPVKPAACTLVLRNEGTLKNEKKSPFIFEVKIPLTALDPESGEISRYITGLRDMDELYGTWRVGFKNRSDELTIRIGDKLRNSWERAGSIIYFTFEDEGMSKRFKKAFRQAIKLCSNNSKPQGGTF